jgi:hypothetical protein
LLRPDPNDPVQLAAVPDWARPIVDAALWQLFAVIKEFDAIERLCCGVSDSERVNVRLRKTCMRKSSSVFAVSILGWLLLAASASSAETAAPMDRIARSYVGLVLELGEHDALFVDAYYGPAEWRAEAKQRKRNLPQLEVEANELAATLAALEPRDADAARRQQFLSSQIEAVRARLDMLQGRKLSFDEESRRLYGVVAPRHDEDHYRNALRAVDAATPGEGTLQDRAEALRQQSIVPPNRLDAVLRRGLQECRERTAKHIALPAGETFSIEYVRGEPWSAYNWYQGGFRSVIQINLDPPFVANRAVELSCHEGYPGHHVYNALLEQQLVRDRGWVEFTVYPLFSPQSLIAEGTADFGTRLAFAAEGSTWHWVGEHLMPMAGLDPGLATVHAKVQAAERPLRGLRIDVAREYLDGRMVREEALRWLMEYGRLALPDAERALRFIEGYRSYVINYSYGEDLVSAHVDAVAGQDPDERWAAYAKLLTKPTTPADLVRLPTPTED